LAPSQTAEPRALTTARAQGDRGIRRGGRGGVGGQGRAPIAARMVLSTASNASAPPAAFFGALGAVAGLRPPTCRLAESRAVVFATTLVTAAAILPGSALSPLRCSVGSVLGAGRATEGVPLAAASVAAPRPSEASAAALPLCEEGSTSEGS